MFYYEAASTWKSLDQRSCYETCGCRSLERAREASRYCAERYGYNTCVRVYAPDHVEEYTYWRHGPGEPVWLEGRIETRQQAEAVLAALAA